MAKVLVDGMACALERAGASFHEPFVGGGAGATEVAKRYKRMSIHVRDLEPGVAEVWRRVASGRVEPIVDRLREYRPTVASFRRAMDARGGTAVERAARGIFLSKTSFSGLGVSPIGGWRQTGDWKIDCKWNPDGIAEALRSSAMLFRGRLVAARDSGVEYIGGLSSTNVAYVDPPYVTAGSSCYAEAMSDVDHARLAEDLRGAACDWTLSYDECPLVRGLYRWARVEEVDHRYSMAPKKKTWRASKELIITARRRASPRPASGRCARYSTRKVGTWTSRGE